MRKFRPDPIRKLQKERLTTRHENELADSWRDLKCELFAQSG